MLTKQEQEILDNAPTAATHYLTSNEFGASYAIYSHGEYETLDDRFLAKGFTWSVKHNLADLRKKQGKTVVDVVNALRGKLDNCWGNIRDEHTHVIYDNEDDDFMTDSLAGHEGHECCTIEEFNQCVKEMSYHAGMGEYNNYLDKHSPLELIKPRTNSEYVTAEFNYFWECAKEFADRVEFFTADLTNECKVNQVRTLEMLLASYKVGAILRKVETEITWQDEAKELLIPATRQYKHNNGIGFLCGYDCDETVQIVADIIEKCHQQVN